MAITGRSRSGVWDDDKQAEFYREFYTIAFGNPQVEAIVTWGLDDERAWLPGIGLIDEKGVPKAVYKELDRLINHEWKTDLTGTTDEDGSFKLRGFFGDYEIEISTEKGTITSRRVKLDSRNENNWSITIGH
jgi:hypothetical protein